MPLRHATLHQLRVFDALARRRSVTRAAERLGVTQPATSASLSRLRRHFGDELLVRDKGCYQLTALAEQLAEPAGEREIRCDRLGRVAVPALEVGGHRQAARRRSARA